MAVDGLTLLFRGTLQALVQQIHLSMRAMLLRPGMLIKLLLHAFTFFFTMHMMSTN